MRSSLSFSRTKIMSGLLRDKLGMRSKLVTDVKATSGGKIVTGKYFNG